jgi:hypothetical protein
MDFLLLLIGIVVWLAVGLMIAYIAGLLWK